MELDSFLASPRWEILKVIIQKPSSPMEISEEIKTTVSFVSQQLKLLEAAGIVKKIRTGAVEKGKPRTIFSISREALYLVPLAKGLDEKKLIPLSKQKKIIIKIWSIEDQKIHITLERFFWNIEPYLEKIEAIFIYIKNILPKAYILSKEPNLTHQLNETQKNSDEKMPLQVIASTSALSKLEVEKIVPIYDPEQSLGEENSLKGGIDKDE